MSMLLPTPHIRSAADVCAFYGVSRTRGLTEAQVAEHRRRFGYNKLHEPPSKPLWQMITEQFEDLLVRILLAAAMISFLLAVFGGDYEREGLASFVEPFVILLILVANAIVAIWQDLNAEKSLEALKKLQPEKAEVLRNGAYICVPSEELVPGDIIKVSVGDKIPADARVIEILTTTFRCEQSCLTGETHSANKEVDALSEEFVDFEIQLKCNLLFSSTTVTNGVGIAVVTATGMDTEIGVIQTAVEMADEEDKRTPLSEKIDEFGDLLSKVIGVICLLVWIMNIGKFSDPVHKTWIRGCLYYFKIAVALAVAAIPEGLPAVITTCLSLGTRKMAQKQAIVRHLPSVETLGCTTVICSDKTGTLTTNEMTTVKFSMVEDEERIRTFSVKGSSYSPVGDVTEIATEKAFSNISANDVSFHWFAAVCALCNQSQLGIDSNGHYTHMGEPTEAALKVLVEKLGCPDESVNGANLQRWKRTDPEAFCSYWSSKFTKVATLEFTRERKSMSVMVKEAMNHSTRTALLVKGAPETILERCTQAMLPSGETIDISPTLRKTIASSLHTKASEALRILAVAVGFNTAVSNYTGPGHPSHALLKDSTNFASIETGLCFLGIAGILDPPRPEVSLGIASCWQAGIRVIMITGDSQKTAEIIATRIGIISEEQVTTCSLTGRQFEALAYDDRKALLSAPTGLVFSRTEPKHKQAIVKILRDLGEVTAMTGDGVNDAPALKQADIGIAMGIAGTEVAKEAADMILADDNFQTIVAAVEEGRGIYNNMKAFIRYLISSNIGEVASIFFTAAIGIPEGLTPVQLLWVNLVTDGLPATALGFNPADVDVMKKPPRNKKDPLISSWIFFRYCVIGLYVGIATVGVFVWWYCFDDAGDHTLITMEKLQSWGTCHNWEGFEVQPVYDMTSDPCSYFQSGGKVKASTLSLTVLVMIEMLNSLNALSEDGSLLQQPPWVNPFLILAILSSVLIHCAILYIPILSKIFGVVPLTIHDWTAVMLWSFPVILIDEVLKGVARGWCSYVRRIPGFRKGVKKDLKMI